VAQSPHPYLGGPWAFYAWWGRLNPFALKATKTPPPTSYPNQPTREKNGAWGRAPTYKPNQSNQFVTFEKLAKSPKFAKVTLKTSTANKPKTKQEIQSRHQNAAAKAAKSAAAKAAKSAAAKKANQPNPHQI